MGDVRNKCVKFTDFGAWNDAHPATSDSYYMAMANNIYSEGNPM